MQPPNNTAVQLFLDEPIDWETFGYIARVIYPLHLIELFITQYNYTRPLPVKEWFRLIDDYLHTPKEEQRTHG